MIGWQWHQLNHMQVICTSLQTYNHANTSSLSFFTGQMLFVPPNQQHQHHSTKGKNYRNYKGTETCDKVINYHCFAQEADWEICQQHTNKQTHKQLLYGHYTRKPVLASTTCPQKMGGFSWNKVVLAACPW